MFIKKCALTAALLLGAGLVWSADKSSADSKLAWDFKAAVSPADTLGWAPVSGFAEPFRIENGSLLVELGQVDAYTSTIYTNFDAASYPALEVRMKASKKIMGHVGIYFKTEENNELAESMKLFKPVALSGQWQNVVIDLKTCLKWQGTITGFRLDFSGEPGIIIEIASIRFVFGQSAAPKAAAVATPALAAPAVASTPGGAAAGAPGKWNFSEAANSDDTLGWQSEAGFARPFRTENGNLVLELSQAFANTSAMETNFKADTRLSLEIRLKASKKCQGHVGIYFKTEDNNELSESMKIYKPVSFSEEWQNVIIDLKQCSKWQGTISGFRIDFNGEPGMVINISSIRFLDKTIASKI